MSQDDHTTRAQRMRAIVETLNEGRPEAALDACEVMLAAAPEDPALNQLAATAALRSGGAEAADRFARLSLAIRPDHGPTLLLAAHAARALGEHARAEAFAARAAEAAPTNADAAFLLTATRIAAGSPAETWGLDRLAARFPDEGSRFEELAETLLAIGRRESALSCLEAAHHAKPSFTLAMRRGLIAKDLGRSAQARQALETALALQPGFARGWFLLGVVLQDLREVSAAEQAYSRASALDPGLAEAAVNLGTLLQERGDLDGAKQAYAQAIKTRLDTFGHVAQAITTSPRGELWLDLRGLRDSLLG